MCCVVVGIDQLITKDDQNWLRVHLDGILVVSLGVLCVKTYQKLPFIVQSKDEILVEVDGWSKL